MSIWTSIEFLSEVLWAGLVLAVVYAALLVQSLLGMLWWVIIFLFDAWVVQALFAAWVAFALQQVHQSASRRASRFEKRYEQKIAAIQTLFGLIDKRIYATRVYQDALRGDDWATERERHREVVREWNERASGALTTMLTLLPARICFEIDREVFGAFSSTDAALGRIRRAPISASRQTLDQDVTRLTKDLVVRSRVLQGELLNIARQEQRLLDRRPEISLANAEHLSFGYLLSALFKPTIDR